MRAVRARRIRFARDQIAMALPAAGVPAKVRRFRAWAAGYGRRPRLQPTGWPRRVPAPRVPFGPWGVARARGVTHGPSEKAVARARRRQRDQTTRGAA